MASQKRVQWAQLRTGSRGGGGDGLAGVLIFLLTGQSNFFSGDFHLRTYMEDSAGMAANDPVRAEWHPGRLYRQHQAFGIARSEEDGCDRHGDPGPVSGSDSGRFESRRSVPRQSARLQIHEHHQRHVIPSTWNRAARLRRCRRRISRRCWPRRPGLLGQFQTILGQAWTACWPLSRAARAISAS